MNLLETHTLEEYMDGICRVCTRDLAGVKRCLGYITQGDRCCDTRHIPGYEEGNPYILCKDHKLKNVKKLYFKNKKSIFAKNN